MFECISEGHRALPQRGGFFSRSIGTIAFLILFFVVGLVRIASASNLEVPAGYRLVWSDEFDISGLPDPTKWVHDTSRNSLGWHNNELQYYSAADGNNAVVKDGRLFITARRESSRSRPDSNGQTYTSARLITRGKAEWTYGFFEIRAKMPCGKGTWPAIWTLGTGGRWPEDGELDIMEHVGSKPEQVSSAVHVSMGYAGQAVTGITPLKTACTEFNRYQMMWTSQHVTFGVNGVAHLVFPKMDAGKRVWPFDAPNYLLLNLAIGGDLGGAVDDQVFPLSMEVDYVRVYQGTNGKGNR